MELRRFQQFVTLAEEGSFTAAAAKLYMAQSTLSASIAALERHLGVDLVIRGRSGVELTAAGRALLEPARRTIADAASAKQAALGHKRGLAPLRVADTFAVPWTAARQAAESMAGRWPRLPVEITHYGLRNVVHRVLDGEIDIAVTPVQYPLPAGLAHIALGSTPIAVICAATHRLAGAAGISMDDLADEALIALPEDSAMREGGAWQFEPANRDRLVTVAASGWIDAVSLARRGYGLALGPQYATDYYPSGIALATFAEPPMMTTAIVMPAEGARHPALDDYVGLLRAELGIGPPAALAGAGDDPPPS